MEWVACLYTKIAICDISKYLLLFTKDNNSTWHWHTETSGQTRSRLGNSKDRQATKLTECFVTHSRHEEFVKTDSLLLPHESRHFFHWQRMCQVSILGLYTQHQLQVFLTRYLVYQTLTGHLSKIGGNTCPMWNPEIL